MDYDFNLTYSGRKVDQAVELEFASGKYRYKTTVNVGGNCTGLDVIETAVSNAYNALEKESNDISKEEYSFLIMKDSEEKELLVEEGQGPGLGSGDDWLKEMLVSARIVSMVPVAKGVHCEIETERNP